MVGALAVASKVMVVLSDGTRLKLPLMIKCQHLRFGTFKPSLLVPPLLKVLPFLTGVED